MPVTVELCPAAISATANKIGAKCVPSKGCNKRCASSIRATSVLPVLKNTVAAKTKIAAFTKNAALSAIKLSIKLYLSARLILCLSAPIFLVCTSAECKYKLCGITVAPIIPTAIYNEAFVNGVGIKPVATSAKLGLAIKISMKNETPMVATSAKINASIFRIP